MRYKIEKFKETSMQMEFLITDYKFYLNIKPRLSINKIGYCILD